MKSNEIERLVENIRFRPSETADKRIVARAEAALEKSTFTKQSVWRTILKSKLPKLAIAAVVIIGVFVGLYFSDGSLDFATPVFGDVAEKLLSQKWVYMFEEDRKDGRIIAEYWYSPTEQKLYAKSHTVEGNAFLLDMNAGEMHEYRGDTIRISKPDDFGHKTGWLEQRLPMLGGLLNRYESEGADIVQRDTVYNSEPALLYEVEMTLPHGTSLRTDKHMWLVDRRTHLPIICEHTHLIGHERNGKFGQSIIRSHRYAFDYSDSGPADIYALGVPTDANIVDDRPNAEIQDLLNKINEAKATTHSSFAAVIREGDMLRRRIIRQGRSFRDEHLELVINHSDWEPKKERYLEEMGESFESINRWLNETKIMSRRIRINDESFTYVSRKWDVDRNQPVEMGRRWGNDDYFTGYCWRYMPSGEIVTTEYSVRYENADGKLRFEIVEFAQTPSGMWYPHKVSPNSQYVIYADDLNAELAEEVDPRSLPNYVDHRELTQQIKMQQQEDPNSMPVEYTGFTPLHMAIYRQKYLDEGAEVEPAYDSGSTPMELAVSSGNLDVVKLLFKYGADFVSNDAEQRSCLGLATRLGHEEVVEFILANGPNVDQVYKGGATALHYAAEKGDVAEVTRLLAHGAKVDIKDDEGRTCLYKAIDSLAGKISYPIPTAKETVERFKEVITLLLEHGADIDAFNNDNYSAFSKSVGFLADDSRNAKQQIEFLTFLLDLGANPNLDAGRGSNSSFWRAVEDRRYDIVRMLLDGGADPWLITNRDYWPSKYNLLHCARKLYELLYPFMKERYERTNKELLKLAARVVRASLDNDMETIRSICVDHPHHRKPWTVWPKEIKKLYERHESLIDNAVAGWFTVDGLAEVYVPIPEGMEEKSVMLGLIQYPDGQWKCIYYRKMDFMPEYEKNLQTHFISDNSLDEFRDHMYDQAGMTE